MRGIELKGKERWGKQATRQFTVKNGEKQFCLTQDKHFLPPRFIPIRKDKEITRRTEDTYSSNKYSSILRFYFRLGRNLAGIRISKVSLHAYTQNSFPSFFRRAQLGNTRIGLLGVSEGCSCWSLWTGNNLEGM